MQPQKAFKKLAVATFALLAACADELPATSYSLGGFQIKIHPDTARVTILGAGGRPLLEGLDGRAVRADGPPLTGFAVREFDPAYEMHLGSFKPVGEAGPWQAVRSLNVDSSLERGLKVVLNDKDGDAVATLAFSAPERGHLRVALTGRGAATRQLSWGYACNADDHFVNFGASRRRRRSRAPGLSGRTGAFRGGRRQAQLRPRRDHDRKRAGSVRRTLDVTLRY